MTNYNVSFRIPSTGQRHGTGFIASPDGCMPFNNIIAMYSGVWKALGKLAGEKLPFNLHVGEYGIFLNLDETCDYSLAQVKAESAVRTLFHSLEITGYITDVEICEVDSLGHQTSHL